MEDILVAAIRMYRHGENGDAGYHFQRPTEGYNGIVYRVIRIADGAEFAVKIMRRDARQRAWRE